MNSDLNCPIVSFKYRKRKSKRNPNPQSGVIDCPYCGKTHTHGYEEGHRLAHCGKGFKHINQAGYYLIIPKKDQDKNGKR